MQWNAVQSNWPAFTEALMQHFPDAQENDLLALEGNRDALVDYIAKVQGVERAEADRQVGEWMQGAVPADVAMDETRDGDNIRASAAHIPVGEDVYSGDKDFGDDQAAEPPVGREVGEGQDPEPPIGRRDDRS
ncbi:hypothetical protein PARPLA_03055 [Rhodobacteraceae bacterium THAF1]|uniref:hypothetical protein n=1 Tax=Palleronia sp. THAF1 TaxID=2587842 RepID=UPI000F3D4FE3|nr:hypothetical protein [Palleronia sp. THAF1]QFU08454.1 hypothetical protein FIU81_07185 [Palleronia sp. THAF1]VDC29340.1 hypothetical protein PARPLA_03055 [Rhodobacteraceae bacterium THAF1]